MAGKKEYILLPRNGLFDDAFKELEPKGAFIRPRIPFVVKSRFADGDEIRVIQSIAANGPKLVELDDATAEKVSRHLEVRKLPLIKYSKPLNNGWLSRETAIPSKYPANIPDPNRPKVGKRSLITIRVMEFKNGIKVPAENKGLTVTAFTDYSARIGDLQETDDSGKVELELSGDTIERLYCPYVWGWGAFYENIPVQPSIEIDLPELNDAFKDCVRRYYCEPSRFIPATGVTVGVIDTGVGPHNDLNVIGGVNAVTNEKGKNFQDDDNHGTFVAGLIGSKGVKFPNLQGLAPGVQIQSYKVFEGFGASNLSLINAIFHAQSDQCDILNLSIEDGIYDEALVEAINFARDNGMLIVAAAGNDGRKPVDYPAAYDGVTAVSALGCEGTFPPNALEEIYGKSGPKGDNSKEFIASFSNIGKQVSVTAFGVGILSTVRGDKYGSCSGTSMAAPVVTGAIASLLSQRPDIFKMTRDRDRSDAIEKLLFENCISRGFKQNYEGHGLPDHDKV